MPYIGHGVTNAGTFYILDDLTMSSSQTYTMQVGGVSVTPKADNLLITLDGVIQHTPDAYTVSGSTITFDSAPGSGVDFYGIIMGQSASIGQGSIGADELKVTGDGSSGQVLASDGDGTFTWTTDTENYLPLAGGTMSGAINLGSQNVTNGGTITGTFVGGITGNVTGNVSGTAPAGTLTGATLASGVTASSLTSVGTLSSLIVTGNVTLNTGDSETSLTFEDAGTNAMHIKVGSGDEIYFGSNNSWQTRYKTDGNVATQGNWTFPGTIICNKHMAVGGETAIASWEDTDNEFSALHLGNAAAVFGSGSGTTNSQAYLATNTYYDGAWKRIGAGEASMINMNDDGHIFFYHAAADAGTAGAGNAITFSQSLKLDVDGTATFGDNVVLATTKGLYFDGGSNTYIKENNDDKLYFYTGGNNTMTIGDHLTLTGRLGVGTSSTDNALYVIGRRSSYTAVNLSEVAGQNAMRFQPDPAHNNSIWFNSVASNRVSISGADDDGSDAVDVCLQPFGGKIGIATTAPGYPLHVVGNMNIDSGYLRFGSGNSEIFDAGGYSLGFKTYTGSALTEKMRLTGSGTLTIGTGGSGTKLVPEDLSNNRRLFIYGSSSNYLALGPYDDNGWVYFLSDGANNGAYFNNPVHYFDVGDVRPYDDNELNLGQSDKRWVNISLINNPTVTSDERKKDNIKTSSLGLEFLNKLNPVQYKWKDYEKFKKASPESEEEFTDEKIKHTYKRTHYGLIAQEVEKVLTDSGMTTDDFAPLVYDKESDSYAMRYGEYVGILIKSIQELSDKLDTANAKITALENA